MYSLLCFCLVFVCVPVRIYSPRSSPHPLSTPVLALVTGHSLGAAMATLAAYDLAVFWGYSVRCVTWAGPRVGDAEFAALFASVVPEMARFVGRHCTACTTCTVCRVCKVCSVCTVYIAQYAQYVQYALYSMYRMLQCVQHV